MAGTAAPVPGSTLKVSAQARLSLSRFATNGRDGASAVCFDGETVLTWAAFRERVARMASALADLGAPQAVVACARPESFLVALFALWQSGRTAVVPPNFLPENMARVGGDSNPVLSDEQVAALSEAAPPQPLTDLDPVACHVVLHTSGSSGEPKQIEKTLAQLEAEVETLESVWGSQMGNATVLATVPHHHVYGLLFRLLWPLSAGRAFDTTVCANPEALHARIARHPAHVLVSSPAHLGRFPLLMDMDGWQPRPRLIFSSGAPLAAESAAAYASAFGSAPTEVFGSTETGGIAWRCQADGVADAWTPLPGIMVARDNDGHLLLDSPFLDRHPWRMDDAVRCLSDGRFHLQGRLDRIVKIEGKRLSLPEMESRLAGHPWIVTAAVVTLPEGGRLGAVVVLSTAGRTILDEVGQRHAAHALRVFLGKCFEAVLLPRRFRFVAGLPIDERGKTSVDALQSLFTTHARTDA